MASTMVHTQSPKALENLGFGSPFASRRSRLSLVETWVSLPSVRTASSITSTPKASHHSRALSLEISEGEVDFAGTGCETPKDHKIPDVDVEVCPPAPKKARGMSRMALACSSAYENPSISLSPCYLF